MEKYVIKKTSNDNIERYVSVIYRNTTSSDRDIGEAIEFENKEMAIQFLRYCKNVCCDKLTIVEIKTEMKELEDD